ncbi:MAG: HlyU family transcriptional regulator [Maritimibacter sp.]
MALFSKLFGGRAAPEVQPELYNDFRIYPEPIKESGGYRVAARIEKEVGGELKTHQMIRADTSQSEDEAREISLRKAKTFIDQMGEGIFR